jgi:hypothetical protein
MYARTCWRMKRHVQNKEEEKEEGAKRWGFPAL